jgi:hypothetical protein
MHPRIPDLDRCDEYEALVYEEFATKQVAHD